MWQNEPAKAQAVRDQAEQAERQKQQALERRQKEQEASRAGDVIERRRAEAEKRNVEIDQRVLKFQQQKAAEGYGGAQYELALRYLNGKGVETNRALAIRWLKSACTNGLSEATNLLAQIQ